MQHYDAREISHGGAPGCAMDQRRYWRTIALSSSANTLALLLAGQLAGLGFEDYVRADRAIVFFDIFALTLLMWPAFAIAVRCLVERRGRGFWGVLLVPVAVFAVMILFFGKPFAIPGLPEAVHLVPSLLVPIIVAWLMVEADDGLRGLWPRLSADGKAAPTPPTGAAVSG